MSQPSTGASRQGLLRWAVWWQKFWLVLGSHEASQTLSDDKISGTTNDPRKHYISYTGALRVS